MLILDLLEALVKLGLPLAGLSWFLFSQLYDAGDIDRNANRKVVKSQVRSLRAVFKRRDKRKDERKDERKENRGNNMVYDRWMWFGSGFYGLAGLWTFLVIEVLDLFNFVFHFPGLEQLFSDGLFSLVMDVVGNQIGNVVSAFVWFGYWDIDSTLLLVLIAYLGYWAGVELARRETKLPVKPWFLAKFPLKPKP